MSDQEIIIFIEGHPKPAGSKLGVALYKGPRNTPKEAREYTGKAIVIDSAGDAGQMWRRLVADELKKRVSRPLTGALQVTAHFYLQRPKKHYYTGAREQQLRPDAPRHHTQAPDTTKLLRAIEDALKGVVWVDDAQIDSQHAHKDWACRWAERSGVMLVIQSHQYSHLDPIRTDLERQHKPPPPRQQMTANGLAPKPSKSHGGARLMKEQTHEQHEHAPPAPAADRAGAGGRRRPRTRRAPPGGGQARP